MTVAEHDGAFAANDDISRDAFAMIYRRAYELGLKGCTVFRPDPLRGSVITDSESGEPGSCCPPDAAPPP